MTKRRALLLLAGGVLAGLVGGLFFWIFSGLPDVKSLEEYSPSESSIVYSSDGKAIAELFIERRTYLPHYLIPDHVKRAFVATEDLRFYSHPGVDLFGIARALWRDIKARSPVEGGSTITQQLARMLFLTPDKSLRRKIREAFLSTLIERRYTKDEILGMYLNQAYFGTRAYGIEAASQTYFGKTTAELTVAEAALLASLPKAPSKFSPFKNPGIARSRRDIALKQMLDAGFITRAQYEEAMLTPLPTSPHLRKYDAPYVIEILRQQLESRFGSELYTSGYKIYSTIDSRMQKAAEEAIVNGLRSIEQRDTSGVEAALVAMELRTGHIKALVGGSNFWKNQFNRATQALRQPGSAFKPFVFAAAIEHGMTSSDVVHDTPISFPGRTTGERWVPNNYDNKFYGAVPLKTALAKSLNCATVRLASEIGMDEVIQMAYRLGIRNRLEHYLPVALGASDVTLMEMVSAYATFAFGRQPKALFYERILNRDGVVIAETVPEMKDVLAEEIVREMRILLKAVVDEGTAIKAKELKRPVYGKTGTTNDYADAWFIGFDERFVVGVWVGRDDHTPIGKKETGARAALPIWIDFMKTVPLQIHEAQNP